MYQPDLTQYARYLWYAGKICPPIISIVISPYLIQTYTCTFIYTYIHIRCLFICIIIFITGAVNVVAEAENLNTISSVHQSNNYSFEVTIVHYIIDDAASDDRAERASIGNCYLYNGRRSIIVSQSDKADKPCKYNFTFVHIQQWRILRLLISKFIFMG